MSSGDDFVNRNQTTSGDDSLSRSQATSGDSCKSRPSESIDGRRSSWVVKEFNRELEN